MYILNNQINLADWQFAQRKYLPHEAKVELTMIRTAQWCEEMDHNVYVSYSGGLDSKVLLHFVRKVLGKDIPAVFANTGLEYPELVSFARKTDGAYEEVKPEKSFKRVILEEGYPVVSKEVAAKIRKLRTGNLSDRYRNYLMYGDERGTFGKLPEKWKFLLEADFKISERCCDIMKKKPFNLYERRNGNCVPFIGTTQDESFMRTHQYAKTGCNDIKSHRKKSQPLGFWTKQDILRYVYENDLEICSVYGDIKKYGDEYELTGVKRTGCIFCAMGCHLEEEPNRFQMLQQTHPQLYDYCMRDISDGGLGMRRVLDYLDIPWWRQMDIKEFIS